MANWKVVGQDFAEDWQFILSTGRLPFFKPFALLALAAPLVTGTGKDIPLGSLAFLPLWLAGLLSMAIVAVTYRFCPRFIRQYENYGIYQGLGNSHRWILWEFYNLREDYSSKVDMISEVINKKLARKPSKVQRPKYPPVATNFVDGFYTKGPQFVGREMELPLLFDNHVYVLSYQENEPALEKRIRELYWIIYSDLTKSSRWARKLIWCMFALVIVLFVFAVALGAWHFAMGGELIGHPVHCSPQLVAVCGFA
ncbi:MAG: hypothetical protein M3O03_05590 [Pseudomonadota bacterium]|nr:hypothetical protein [Pseudomonadota bacterium]